MNASSGGFLRAAMLTLVIVAAARAQTPEEQIAKLAKEVEALKEGQKALQRDMDQIRRLLAKLAGPPEFKEATLNLAGAPVMGNANAKVTVVEFSDYQCPFCARHATQVLPQLVTDYIKAGKVKYVIKNFPLQSIHSQAAKAAEAALCAGDQGKYWEMHDKLLANPKTLDPKNLSLHAQSLSLDMAKFQPCLDTGKYSQTIPRDLAEGQEAGVNGTPSFFFGLTEPGKATLRATKRLEGAYPYANFKQLIDGFLAPAK